MRRSFLIFAAACLSATGPLPAINNTPIGSTTPSTGAFTTLGANSGATFSGLLPSVATGQTGFGGGSLFLNTPANNVTPLRIVMSEGLSGTTAVSAINAHATVFGALTFPTTGAVYSLSVDSDRVTAPGGMYGLQIGIGFGGGGGTGLEGGRTGLGTNLTMTGDVVNGSSSGAFYVAEGPFVTASYWNGGYPGHEAGSLFGINPSGRAQNLGTIGSYGYRGAVGAEMDVGMAHPMLAKHGMSVVEWTDSNSDGWLLSSAYDAAVQGTGTAPGFDRMFSVGSPFGWWPVQATGTIIGNYATTLQAGGPAAQAAVGIDWTGVTLNYFGYKQTGAAIDGSGNVGGLTTYGAAIQTQGQIKARTAVINTIMVVTGKGGEFNTIPSLVVSSSPGGGSTATASVATMGLRRAVSLVGNRGTGYVVGNVLTLSGGTSTAAATATVAAVDSTGAIIDFTYTPGSYSVLPSDPVTLTGGTGSNAKITQTGWTILTVSVTGAGTLYSEFPPPLVSTSGGTKAVEPMFGVAMTGSTANLLLGLGTALATNAAVGHVLLPTTSGAPTGTVGAAGQAATIIRTDNHKICHSEGSGTWYYADGSACT